MKKNNESKKNKTLAALKKTQTKHAEQAHDFLEKLTFARVFFLWLIMILIFGIIYHTTATDTSYLVHTKSGEPVNNYLDSIYFSSITATTTGFGDITPRGIFKLLSIIEVILGLLVLAFVTYKLVSLKQNVMLEEMYEITFTERVNRIRSSLLFFRQTIHNLLHKIEDETIKQRDIKNFYLSLASFGDTLADVSPMIFTKHKHLTKEIESVDAGIICNSVLHSIERIYEFIYLLDYNNIKWKTEKNILLLKQCITLTNKLFIQVIKSKKILPNQLNPIIEEKDKLISSLTSILPREKNKE